MTNIRFQLLAVLILALFVSHAHAQFVVKRVKCADSYAVDLFDGWVDSNFPYHRNWTSSTKNLAVQIIRDGCRPKWPEGQFFFVTLTASSAFVSTNMVRTKRYPASVVGEIQSGHALLVRFSPSDPNARVSGTFDYMYSWE